MKNRIRRILCAAAALMLTAGLTATAVAQEAVTEVAQESATEAESESTELHGTYNLLLVGLDVRADANWNGNSDSMILVTVNHDVDKIFLTSFMRDMYAEIPGVGGRKLNNAYAVGGADLLEETLKDNFGVKIDNYCSATFGEAAKIIDLLGGVDLELSDAEIAVADGYLEEVCASYGEGQTPDGNRFAGAGMQHLNGIQTVAYARIRYVGNNDYERTERQRRVLKALRESVDFTQIGEVTDFIKQVLEITENDIGTLDLLAMLAILPQARGYEIEEQRLPYDGLYHSSGEQLVPDQPATNDRLLGTIYAEN